MSMLIAAAAAFLAIHLLVAGTRARDGLVSALGENAYLGLFSLVSAGVIVWMVLAYNAAQGSGDSRVLYDLGRGVRDLGIPIVAIAFLLAVPGLLTPNPTTVRQEAVARKVGAVRGVLRITRHPFLWGVAIWAAFHVAANGDEASVVFFGTFLVLALLGTLSIDAKRRRKREGGWTDFASKTSNVPFGAILSGRTSFSAKEYFDWRFLLALIVFIALLFAHAALFGVNPFPGTLAAHVNHHVAVGADDSQVLVGSDRQISLAARAREVIRGHALRSYAQTLRPAAARRSARVCGCISAHSMSHLPRKCCDTSLVWMSGIWS